MGLHRCRRAGNGDGKEEPAGESAPVTDGSGETVLVVDDEKEVRRGLARCLELSGYRVHEAASGAEALDGISLVGPDLVLLDVRLPDMEGVEVLKRIRREDPDLPVIMITGHASVETAVQAMKLGAYEYLEKPSSFSALRGLVKGALRTRAFRPSLAAVREGESEGQLPIVGSSPAMRKVLRSIQKLSSSRDSTVMVTGESGTGKELVARAIHYTSQRADGPFVAINCAALTPTLLESELFGYADGSFTGARRKGKNGLFHAAHGGTLFLDEIGEMDITLQAKVLRAIQEKAFLPVGAVQEIAVDLRIVASTNRNLDRMVELGRFREDLYYRLCVIPLNIPPLRDRKKDILELAYHFLSQYSQEFGKGRLALSPDAATVLEGHVWSGNVRELKGVMEHAALVAEGSTILPEHLGLQSRSWRDRGQSAPGMALTLTDRRLKTMERLLIEKVLGDTRWNVSEAASVLGINRSTLYNKMRAFDMRRDGNGSEPATNGVEREVTVDPCFDGAV
jgi:DNA-binding NtrC family response regulator